MKMKKSNRLPDWYKIPVWLHKEKDQDLISFLETQGKRGWSNIFKRALRASIGIDKNYNTNEDDD